MEGGEGGMAVEKLNTSKIPSTENECVNLEVQFIARRQGNDVKLNWIRRQIRDGKLN